mgnify:CR=1 FL=1
MFIMAISGMAGSNFSATKESKYFFYSSVWGALAAIIAILFFLHLDSLNTFLCFPLTSINIRKKTKSSSFFIQYIIFFIADFIFWF